MLALLLGWCQYHFAKCLALLCLIFLTSDLCFALNGFIELLQAKVLNEEYAFLSNFVPYLLQRVLEYQPTGYVLLTKRMNQYKDLFTVLLIFYILFAHHFILFYSFSILSYSSMEYLYTFSHLKTTIKATYFYAFLHRKVSFSSTFSLSFSQIILFLFCHIFYPKMISQLLLVGRCQERLSIRAVHHRALHKSNVPRRHQP